MESPEIKPIWWSPLRLPITDNGDGDPVTLDLDPQCVVAEGWRAFLERYAVDLGSGRLRFEGGELVAR